MSNSEKLRETHAIFGGGLGIQSLESMSQEQKIRTQQLSILEAMLKRCPSLGFSHTTTLSKMRINTKLRHLMDDFGKYQSNPASSIKPDGGFFWVHLPNGMTKLVLTSEAKIQGTNARRIEEGLKKQSAGNAVERTCKNVAEVTNFMRDESYFPYLIVLSGCDFREKSSIRDRLTSCNLASEPNRCYVHKIKDEIRCETYTRTSLFMRDEEWTEEEILRLSLEVAFSALDVILLEYGKSL